MSHYTIERDVTTTHVSGAQGDTRPPLTIPAPAETQIEREEPSVRRELSPSSLLLLFQVCPPSPSPAGLSHTGSLAELTENI